MGNLGSCPCQGLVLTRELIRIMDLSSSDRDPSVSKESFNQNVRKARADSVHLSKRILDHLENAYNQADASLKAKTEDDMVYLRQRYNMLKFGEESDVLLTFDDIRNKIHTRPEIQQLMVCDHNNEAEAQVIKVALIIAGGKQKELEAEGMANDVPIEVAAMLLDEAIQLCSGRE